MKRMACVIALATGTGVAIGATALPVLAEPIPNAAADGLQIAIAAPETITGDSTITLSVNFQGGNIRSIELYADGNLIKRQAIRTRQGHGLINFALDGSVLTEGEHEIVIKAFDAAGNPATSTTRVRVSPDENQGLVRFAFPKRNTMVQGVVPIELKLDSSIRSPYVMFFVDKDFLALTNYAPFTYNWDSTHVSNGPHVLSVKAFDGETTAEVQMLKISVNVNNPGGFTNRQKDVPDLNAKAAAKTNSAPAESALPSSRIDPAGLGANLMRNMAARMSGTALRNSGTPRGSVTGKVAERALPGVPNGIKPVVPADLLKPATTNRHSAFAMPGHPIMREHDAQRGMPVAPVNPPSFAALSNPASLLPIPVAPKQGLARQSFRMHHAGNIAAMPGDRLDTPTTAPNAHGKLSAAPSTPRAEKALVGPAILANHGKTFDVVFDDTRIAFDVPPRIEQGLPLAPFRAIFEHTGGTVEWFNQSKTVHAFNSSHEVEFRIGQKQAKVNNQTVQMAAKPYIDRGRAIVPLSFVRDSMDVNVQYDPKTGHLRIESKK